MNKAKTKQQNRKRRHKRIRATMHGNSKVPRLAFFRSNKYIYAQLIDDNKSRTLLGLSSRGMKGKTMTDQARQAGTMLAKQARAKKINKIVFDKGGFSYTGKVKAFADSARKGGLKF